MDLRRKTLSASLLLCSGTALAGGPYPAQTGISAAADHAGTAGMNPAGITRFDERNMRFEVLGFFTDNTFEGQIGDSGPTFQSVDDGTTIIPSGNVAMPLRDNLWFGFTVLGSGFSEDYGEDWIGRYFIQEYDLIYLSAFPSLATKINDKLSVAGSLAITYTSYEQVKAVPNVDDPSDGQLAIEADGFTLGFSLSTLYEFSDKTRVGLVYRSELDPSLEGSASFSGLTATTENILEAAGLLNATVDVVSRTPQAINAGIYHEFADAGAVTFDFVWSDFSEFKLSEIYVNGSQLIETDPTYEDIFAVSAGYSRPINDRWKIGFGALYIDDMIEDENRTITLRLDSGWSAGVGVEWLWKDNRSITASLNYLELGEAPVTSPELPGIGSISGSYTDRGTIWLQVALSLGSGPR